MVNGFHAEQLLCYTDINNTCTATKNFRISQISNPAFGRNEANHAKQLYCAIYMIAKNTCTTIIPNFTNESQIIKESANGLN